MTGPNPNLYADARDDIEQMYGAPNDRSDYGSRSVPLRGAVQIETVAEPAEPPQLDLFFQDPEVEPAPEKPKRAVLGSRAMKNFSSLPPSQPVIPRETARERGFKNIALVQARKDLRARRSK